MIAPALAEWLLDSDPALRWQVERDLLHAPAAQWQATRARTATEGWGARLLALQDPDGQWAGGAFFPKHEALPTDERPEGQPWTATSWSLAALREWGVPAEALGDTAALLAANSRWEYDDLPYWHGEVDCCVNAATLASGAWLHAEVDGLATWFLEHRLTDGGWNCDWVEGATRSSFHSTMNSLRGLLEWQQRTPREHAPALWDAVRDARHAGEAYLLERRLLFRRTTGAPVGEFATEFTHPFRWRYSALRALDHLREAAVEDGRRPDPRATDAIAVVRGRRRADGTWLQEGRHAGAVWFETDAPPGEPSKWLTLIGTRVLQWWDDAAA